MHQAASILQPHLLFNKENIMTRLTCNLAAFVCLGLMATSGQAAIITNNIFTNNTDPLTGNFAPQATASRSGGEGTAANINDADFATYVQSAHTAPPYSVTLTWSSAVTIDTIWLTMGRTSTWNLYDDDDNLIGSGSYNIASDTAGTQKLTIDAISTTSLTVEAIGRNGGGSQRGRIYEIQVIPEPGSLALLGLGGLLMLGRGRKA